jgi:hypothetical protein
MRDARTSAGIAACDSLGAAQGHRSVPWMIVPEDRVKHDPAPPGGSPLDPLDGAGGGLATAPSCGFLSRAERLDSWDTLGLSSSLDAMGFVSSGFLESGSHWVFRDQSSLADGD